MGTSRNFPKCPLKNKWTLRKSVQTQIHAPANSQQGQTTRLPFERLALQQIGKLFRNPAHPPVCCPSHLLRSVLARLASPARPLNYLVFGCPACCFARILCPQRLLCCSHHSAIPGQRSTDLHVRRKGAYAPTPLRNCRITHCQDFVLGILRIRCPSSPLRTRAAEMA